MQEGQKPRILIKNKIKQFLMKRGYELLKVPAYAAYEQKFRYFARLYDSIRNIEGDIVECGIGRGHSFLTIASLTSAEKAGRTVWGFDSFEGFPEPSIFDESLRNPQKGEWKVSTPESIINFLAGKGGLERQYIEEHIRIIKGFFSDSLKNYTGGHVAFMHLDVDLYESYKTCLEFFWPKISKGGVVLFDEYRGGKDLIKFPGAAKAIDEFFGQEKKFIRVDASANRYYIYKAS